MATGGVAGCSGRPRRCRIRKARRFIAAGCRPDSDVANTRKIAAAIVGGRFLSRSEPDQEMKALDEQYAKISNGGAAETH